LAAMVRLALSAQNSLIYGATNPHVMFQCHNHRCALDAFLNFYYRTYFAPIPIAVAIVYNVDNSAPQSDPGPMNARYDDKMPAFTPKDGSHEHEEW
jgi:hypothetical protein